jgi:threonine aldolase
LSNPTVIDAEAERKRVLRSCTKFLGHPPRTVRERLSEIASEADPDLRPDHYGSGALLEDFERDIAQLLGKEAAVFMPSGTMAQQIALRIHADARRTNTIALHPQSHLLVSEANALHALHDLRGVPAGDRYKLYTLADLQAIAQPLAAVLLELPERNIGGPLRPWSEVLEICAWANSHGVAMHLDGARLWESQPFYGKPLDELARPFDTVYVSFYKILNAVAGAALAGPAPIIAQARQWQWRHGGRLVQQYPMVLSARAGLHDYLPRVPLYCERAREIALQLAGFERIAVTPNPPPTNMMHAYLKADASRAAQAALQVAEETKSWMIGALRTTPLPGWQMFEIQCAEGSLDVSGDEVRAWFERLFELL